MSLKERCPILHFEDLGDERGKLVVIEGGQAVPFEIQRVFYIYESDVNVVRGQHANRESEFVLINVAGQSKVRITDGKEEFIVELNRPMMGVYIPKMVWKDMYDFSHDSVLLVLASTHYDSREYLRNYDEYLSLPEIAALPAEQKYRKTRQPVLSLCMPTNGVSEWVFPSLDSIYGQGVEEDVFEVVIMDNGGNEDFRKQVEEYSRGHKNLKYYQTEKALFLSEPESYKKAAGELIKFVNHRNIMRSGSIQYLIDFANRYKNERPVIYFSNGATKQGNERIEYASFGKFVEALGYYSTWSSGMAIWKSDMDDMMDYEDYNFLFPHTDILFHRRDADTYIIDGSHLWDEARQGRKPKGNYNVFYAFAVEFPYILLELVRDKSISMEEFLSVKRSNLDFITQLYASYIVKKGYCSYDLADYKKSLNTFYSEKEVVANMVTFAGTRVVAKARKTLVETRRKLGGTQSERTGI